MESKVQKEIYDTIHQIEELKAIQRHYNNTATELDQYEKELAAINKKLKKELADIEKMESLSVKSLFHKVLGSKEEQMEKERQDYLQISLKHKECVKEIELLEYELNVLEKKVENIDDHTKKLDRLKALREKEILSHPSGMRTQLVALHRRMDETKKIAVELTEAYRAGDNAIQSIKRVITYLRDAKKWGDWDRMSKGGYYDRKKYGSIDRAVNESYQSKRLLTHFGKELRDVGINIGKIDVHIESFGGFLDQLFDNLITDWIVQNKIVNALRNTEMTHDKVVRIIRTLHNDLEQQNQQLIDLQSEKDSLLLS